MANDLVSFEESVKNRIKDIVAKLIPEDRWENIVKITIQDFEQSDLPKIIKAELTERYKKMLTSELSKPEWIPTWDIDSSEQASDAVKNLIIQSAPLILSGLIGSVTQNMMQQFRNSIASYRGY